MGIAHRDGAAEDFREHEGFAEVFGEAGAERFDAHDRRGLESMRGELGLLLSLLAGRRRVGDDAACRGGTALRKDRGLDRCADRLRSTLRLIALASLLLRRGIWARQRRRAHRDRRRHGSADLLDGRGGAWRNSGRARDRHWRRHRGGCAGAGLLAGQSLQFGAAALGKLLKAALGVGFGGCAAEGGG